ncbi:MAG TPA: NADH:flavin oxidoreductase [Firmicutes bacterium]|nr:NADH:flavin oxidoreductase [Bacillota bacterium]
MILVIGVPHLDTPISIRGVEIRNRIVMPPMVRFGWAGPLGEVTDRHVEHYARRARGGVGLIIVEAAAVAPNGKLAAAQLGVWDDMHIPGLRRITHACHRAGAKILLQVGHAGGNTTFDNIGETPVAPAGVPLPGKEALGAPRPLTQAEIRGIVRQFGLAAARAEAAGFDGVEIHGAHGYLLSQFLSPVTNRRTDEYGGPLENRARFLLEVVREVRARVGPGFIVGYRLGARDLVPGGLGIEESQRVAVSLEAEGVDLIHVSHGVPGEALPSVPPGSPYSYLVHLAPPIKAVVRVPVIAVGRIVDPGIARSILENGMADMVAIGRALLADPEWANKAIAGRDREIARCRQCEGGCRRARDECPVGRD